MTQLKLMTLTLTLVLLSGCTVIQPSQPTQFYHLPMAEALQQQSTIDAPYLTLMKVQLPDYLNRSSIIIRRDPTQIDVSQLEQWAGSLTDNIARVLQSQLRNALPQWQLIESLNGSYMGSSHQLIVNIHRFDGQLNETINLNATWQLFNESHELISQHLFSANRDCGDSTSAMVQTMTMLLDDLAQNIANKIPRA